jgi:hypothetical protein
MMRGAPLPGKAVTTEEAIAAMSKKMADLNILKLMLTLIRLMYLNDWEM